MINAALLGLCLLGADGPNPSAGLPEGYELIDRIRAVVDDKVITDFELQRALAPLATAAYGIVDEKERAAWLVKRTQEVLTEQINTILLLEEARKLDLRIQPADTAYYLSGLKQENGWDDDQLLEQVRAQGFPSLSAYTEHVEKEMLRTQVLQLRLASRIRPSQDDLQRQFKRDYDDGKSMLQIHAQHILIKVPSIATPDQIRELAEKAERVRQMAVTEEKPFSDLAAEFGEDRTRDGDLGYFGRCEFDPEFEKAAFGLPAGQISPVIRTRFGYHVIRILDTRRVPLTDATAAKRCIRMNLETENRLAAYDGFVTELRLTHNVEVRQ